MERPAGPRAALALALLVPAPRLGVLAGLVLWPGTPIGLALFSFSKLWLFALPAVWTRWVAREPLGLSPARRGGYGAGIVSGLLLSAAVVGAWLLWGDRLVDAEAMGRRIRGTGLDSPARFLAGGLYFVLVNSLLEEYAWRWFCLDRCRELLPDRWAVPLAALFFTLHHFLAVLTLASTSTAAVASVGVLAGGVVWGGLRVRYGSVRPGWLSHALVDAAVFGVGAAIAFGGGE